MRPKKRILIIGGDTPERAVLSCALRVHQYHVSQADGPRSAVLDTMAAPDLLIVLWPVGVKPMNMLRTRLEKLAGFPLPLVVIAPASEMFNTLAIHADATLMTNVPMAEMLERIKVIAVRKRGPRKGSKHSRMDASTADCVSGVA